MAKKKEPEKVRTCADCIHEWACQMWNVGTLHFADSRYCANYETVQSSNAYFIGFREGQKAQASN